MEFSEVINPSDDQVEVIVVQGIPEENKCMIDKKRFDESTNQGMLLLIVDVIALFENNGIWFFKVAMHFNDISIAYLCKQVAILSYNSIQ